MANTRYIVDVEYRTPSGADPVSPSVTRSVDKMEAAFRNMRSGASELATTIGSRVVGAMDAVVGKTMEVAKWGAMIGGGAIVAGVTAGVTKLNAELESTTIALGTIFNANAVTQTLPEGLELAEKSIMQMRQDAKMLPGELSDLLNIFRLGAIPALHSGLSVEGWTTMSAKAMAAAASANLDMGMAAREFAMLMEGRSGAHNVFGMKLLSLSGDKAAEFNEMAAHKRMELLSKELDKYAASLEVFGKSYEGVTSTFVDSAKQWVTAATKPLFVKFKEAVGAANEWVDENKALLESWADFAGKKLVEAFEWGKKKIEEWWPVVRDFSTRAWQKLQEIWEKIAPAVERSGSALKAFMQDPAAIDKLITLLKLYATIKVGQSSMGTVSSLGKMGMGAAQMAANLGLIGGSAASAAGAAGAGGAATSAAAAVGGIGAAGLGTAGAAIASGYLLAYQELMLFVDVIKLTRDEQAADTKARREFAQRQISKYEEMGMKWDEVTTYAARDINNLRISGQDAAAALYELELAAYQARQSLDDIAKSKFVKDRADDIYDDALDAATAGQVGWVQKQLTKKGEHKGKHAPGHKGGAGGTSIQKVEIVVTSNQHPSRIARAVADELVQLGRDRRSSPFVRNYSATGTL